MHQGLRNGGGVTFDVQTGPNPFDSYIEVQRPRGSGEIQLFNIAGDLIIKTEGSRLNTNFVPPGVYMINLNTKAGPYCKKMI